MDWLTFIVGMTSALAWPATAIVAVALLRGALVELIPSLRRLKYKELELEFGQKLDAVVIEAEQAKLPEPAPPVALPPAPASKLEVVAEVAPRAAVLEAYRQVEVAGDQALRRVGIDPPRSSRARAQILEKAGIVTSSTGGLLRELSELRNLAAHSEDVELTSSQAVQYARLAERVVTAINVSSEQLDSQRVEG
jgi:hypothetical protein